MLMRMVSPVPRLHDAIAGVGVGNLGTTSASPSISVARSAAFLAIIVVFANLSTGRFASTGGFASMRQTRNTWKAGAH
jgi:hypothetical protein